MTEIKRQIELIKELRLIRSKYQRLELSSLHYRYLVDFLRRHKWFVSGLLILLLVQGLIEAALIIFSRNQLSGDQQLFLAPFFWRFFFAFLVIFLINSFFSIRQEKTFMVLLANKIRRRLFKDYINKPLASLTQDNKADLMAKISYHIPLVSTGVSNSFFGFIRWLICLMVAVWISFLAGLNWTFILGAIIIFSLVIAIAAYFVARRYISQEVTFYSQMIRYVDINLSEKSFLKVFNQEPLVLKGFDRLVDFDSFFRIRRDLWMKMGGKVVFAILLIVSVLTHFFSQDFFSLIGLLNASQKFLFFFLLIYFSRALYEGLRVGLYFFPARLGLFLTIIRGSILQSRRNVLELERDLIFYSRKTKIFKEDVYHRNLMFKFLKGDRVLFFGGRRSGKSSLARTFAGLSAFNSKSLKVKIDGRRLDYSSWQKIGRGTYFFDFDFRSQGSLMEFILGRDKTDISQDDIALVLRICSDNKELADLVSASGNFNQAADTALSNPLAAFALQALHCLVNKPAFIIVDNPWLDLNYPEINGIIKTLDCALPGSILLLFSNSNNKILDYNNIYALDKKIEKIK